MIKTSHIYLISTCPAPMPSKYNNHKRKIPFVLLVECDSPLKPHRPTDQSLTPWQFLVTREIYILQPFGE